METVDAREKLGSAEALRLAKSAWVVLIARGKGVVRFSMKKDRPDDDTLLTHLLGPTGSLRAPTLRVGRTLVVGYGESVFKEVFRSE